MIYPTTPKTYKFIRIGQDAERTQHDSKPAFWIVNIRSNMPIGQVFWYPLWRMWTAQFREGSVWSADCLRCVESFIEELRES